MYLIQKELIQHLVPRTIKVTLQVKKEIIKTISELVFIYKLFKPNHKFLLLLHQKNMC